MVVLGVVILLAVAVATATVVANGSDDAPPLNLVGLEIETSVAGIFALGALCLLLAVLGLFLLLGGAKRSRRKRKEVRDLRRQAGTPAAQEAAPGGSVVQGGDPVRNERAVRRHERHDGHPEDPDGRHFEGVPRD